MNYNEKKSSKKTGGIGFYTIIACCLIAIGATAWFAVSKMDKSEPKNNDISSYESQDDSYNSITSPSAENTAGVESEVPYKEESSTVSEQKPESKAESTVSEAKQKGFVMPSNGSITKTYSDTALQYSKTYGDMRIHQGIDITCKSDERIKASANGVVSNISDDAFYGKVISIDCGEGIVVRYCGMKDVNVKTGDSVSAGTVLGTVGNVPCECEDGTHIHIETLKDGELCSPASLFGLE